MRADATLSRQISASLLRLCSRSAFLATLVFFARFEISEEVPTAATDGKTIFLNPAFYGGLSAPERDGLILHEVLHAALLHVPRRGGRDRKLWNIAADIVVNGMISKEGLALPAGGVRDERREHLGVEEVYELVLRDAGQDEQGGALPEIVEDLLAGPPSDAEGAGLSQSGMQDSAEALEDHWREALERAKLVAQSSFAGDLPAGLHRELGALPGSRLDWRSHLWRYLTQTPNDFSDFDRRFVGQGLYLDTIAGESVLVLVAVDTSGSIDHDHLHTFIAELQGILRAYPHLQCELFYADTEVHGPFPLKPHDPIPPPIGGGGTDFRPFFEQIAGHQFFWGRSIAIYLTDGYGDFPATPPRHPVLWVVTPGGLDLAGFPFGETVRLLPSAETPFITVPTLLRG